MTEPDEEAVTVQPSSQLESAPNSNPVTSDVSPKLRGLLQLDVKNKLTYHEIAVASKAAFKWLEYVDKRVTEREELERQKELDEKPKTQHLPFESVEQPITRYAVLENIEDPAKRDVVSTKNLFAEPEVEIAPDDVRNPKKVTFEFNLEREPTVDGKGKREKPRSSSEPILPEDIVVEERSKVESFPQFLESSSHNPFDKLGLSQPEDRKRYEFSWDDCDHSSDPENDDSHDLKGDLNMQELEIASNAAAKWIDNIILRGKQKKPKSDLIDGDDENVEASPTSQNVLESQPQFDEEDLLPEKRVKFETSIREVPPVEGQPQNETEQNSSPYSFKTTRETMTVREIKITSKTATQWITRLIVRGQSNDSEDPKVSGQPDIETLEPFEGEKEPLGSKYSEPVEEFETNTDKPDDPQISDQNNEPNTVPAPNNDGQPSMEPDNESEIDDTSLRPEFALEDDFLIQKRGRYEVSLSIKPGTRRPKAKTLFDPSRFMSPESVDKEDEPNFDKNPSTLSSGANDDVPVKEGMPSDQLFSEPPINEDSFLLVRRPRYEVFLEPTDPSTEASNVPEDFNSPPMPKLQPDSSEPEPSHDEEKMSIHQIKLGSEAASRWIDKLLSKSDARDPEPEDEKSPKVSGKPEEGVAEKRYPLENSPSDDAPILSEVLEDDFLIRKRGTYEVVLSGSPQQNKWPGVVFNKDRFLRPHSPIGSNIYDSPEDRDSSKNKGNDITDDLAVPVKFSQELQSQPEVTEDSLEIEQRPRFEIILDSIKPSDDGKAPASRPRPMSRKFGPKSGRPFLGTEMANPLFDDSDKPDEVEEDDFLIQTRGQSEVILKGPEESVPSEVGPRFDVNRFLNFELDTPSQKDETPTENMSIRDIKLGSRAATRWITKVISGTEEAEPKDSCPSSCPKNYSAEPNQPQTIHDLADEDDFLVQSNTTELESQPEIDEDDFLIQTRESYDVTLKDPEQPIPSILGPRFDPSRFFNFIPQTPQENDPSAENMSIRDIELGSRAATHWINKLIASSEEPEPVEIKEQGGYPDSSPKLDLERQNALEQVLEFAEEDDFLIQTRGSYDVTLSDDPAGKKEKPRFDALRLLSGDLPSSDVTDPPVFPQPNKNSEDEETVGPIRFSDQLELLPEVDEDSFTIVRRPRYEVSLEEGKPAEDDSTVAPEGRTVKWQPEVPQTGDKLTIHQIKVGTEAASRWITRVIDRNEADELDPREENDTLETSKSPQGIDQILSSDPKFLGPNSDADPALKPEPAIEDDVLIQKRGKVDFALEVDVEDQNIPYKPKFDPNRYSLPFSANDQNDKPDKTEQSEDPAMQTDDEMTPIKNTIVLESQPEVDEDDLLPLERPRPEVLLQSVPGPESELEDNLPHLLYLEDKNAPLAEQVKRPKTARGRPNTDSTDPAFPERPGLLENKDTLDSLQTTNMLRLDDPGTEPGITPVNSPSDYSHQFFRDPSEELEILTIDDRARPSDSENENVEPVPGYPIPVVESLLDADKRDKPLDPKLTGPDFGKEALPVVDEMDAPLDPKLTGPDFGKEALPVVDEMDAPLDPKLTGPDSGKEALPVVDETDAPLDPKLTGLDSGKKALPVVDEMDAPFDPKLSGPDSGMEALPFVDEMDAPLDPKLTGPDSGKEALPVVDEMDAPLDPKLSGPDSGKEALPVVDEMDAPLDPKLTGPDSGMEALPVVEKMDAPLDPKLTGPDFGKEVLPVVDEMDAPLDPKLTGPDFGKEALPVVDETDVPLDPKLTGPDSGKKALPVVDEMDAPFDPKLSGPDSGMEALPVVDEMDAPLDPKLSGPDSGMEALPVVEKMDAPLDPKLSGPDFEKEALPVVDEMDAPLDPKLTGPDSGKEALPVVDEMNAPLDPKLSGPDSGMEALPVVDKMDAPLDPKLSGPDSGKEALPVVDEMDAPLDPKLTGPDSGMEALPVVEKMDAPLDPKLSGPDFGKEALPVVDEMDAPLDPKLTGPDSGKEALPVVDEMDAPLDPKLSGPDSGMEALPVVDQMDAPLDPKLSGPDSGTEALPVVDEMDAPLDPKLSGPDSGTEALPVVDEMDAPLDPKLSGPDSGMEALPVVDEMDAPLDPKLSGPDSGIEALPVVDEMDAPLDPRLSVPDDTNQTLPLDDALPVAERRGSPLNPILLNPNTRPGGCVVETLPNAAGKSKGADHDRPSGSEPVDDPLPVRPKTSRPGNISHLIRKFEDNAESEPLKVKVDISGRRPTSRLEKTKRDEIPKRNLESPVPKEPKVALHPPPKFDTAEEDIMPSTSTIGSEKADEEADPTGPMGDTPHEPENKFPVVMDSDDQVIVTHPINTLLEACPGSGPEVLAQQLAPKDQILGDENVVPKLSTAEDSKYDPEFDELLGKPGKNEEAFSVQPETEVPSTELPSDPRNEKENPEDDSNEILENVRGDIQVCRPKGDLEETTEKPEEPQDKTISSPDKDDPKMSVQDVEFGSKAAAKWIDKILAKEFAADGPQKSENEGPRDPQLEDDDYGNQNCLIDSQDSQEAGSLPHDARPGALKLDAGTSRSFETDHDTDLSVKVNNGNVYTDEKVDEKPSVADELTKPSDSLSSDLNMKKEEQPSDGDVSIPNAFPPKSGDSDLKLDYDDVTREPLIGGGGGQQSDSAPVDASSGAEEPTNSAENTPTLDTVVDALLDKPALDRDPDADKMSVRDIKFGSKAAAKWIDKLLSKEVDPKEPQKSENERPADPKPDDYDVEETPLSDDVQQPDSPPHKDISETEKLGSEADHCSPLDIKLPNLELFRGTDHSSMNPEAKDGVKPDKGDELAPISDSLLPDAKSKIDEPAMDRDLSVEFDFSLPKFSLSPGNKGSDSQPNTSRNETSILDEDKHPPEKTFSETTPESDGKDPSFHFDLNLPKFSLSQKDLEKGPRDNSLNHLDNETVSTSDPSLTEPPGEDEIVEIEPVAKTESAPTIDFFNFPPEQIESQDNYKVPFFNSKQTPDDNAGGDDKSDQPSYPIDPMIGKDQPRYPIDPMIGKDQPSYPIDPMIGKDQPSYPIDPIIGKDQPSYPLDPMIGKDQPSYPIDPMIGKDQPSYPIDPMIGKDQPSYPIDPVIGKDQPSYPIDPMIGKDQPSYPIDPMIGKDQPSYPIDPIIGKDQPSYPIDPMIGKDQPSYPIDPMIGKDQPSYPIDPMIGKDQPSYPIDPIIGKDQPSYPIDPMIGKDQPSYPIDPIIGKDQPSYPIDPMIGKDQPSYPIDPMIGKDQPSYPIDPMIGKDQPSYPIDPIIGKDQPSYPIDPMIGKDQPSYPIDPIIGKDQPSYPIDPMIGKDQPSYPIDPMIGKDQLSYPIDSMIGKDQPSYPIDPIIGKDQPSYPIDPMIGKDQPSYPIDPMIGKDQPSYPIDPIIGKDQPSYPIDPMIGKDQPSYPIDPMIGKDQPSYPIDPMIGKDQQNYSIDPIAGEDQPSYHTDPMTGAGGDRCDIAIDIGDYARPEELEHLIQPEPDTKSVQSFDTDVLIDMTFEGPKDSFDKLDSDSASKEELRSLLGEDEDSDEPEIVAKRKS